MKPVSIINGTKCIGNFSWSSDQYNPEVFCLIPSVLNPRWIIPLKTHHLFVSSLSLYQPSLLRARIAKGLAIVLARLGIVGLLFKDRLYFERNDEIIKKIFNRNDLYYAIFTGTECSHRKVTVQVMNEKGRILGYIKIADSDKIDALLRNEAEILRDLSNQEVEKGLFPEVLYYGSAGDGNILVLDTLKSHESSYSSKLSEKHIEFLAEVFIKTSIKETPFVESSFFDLLNDRVRSSEKEHYRKTLNYLERILGNEKLPFGLCHRDFTPWNTFFHKGILYVFDWEYSKREYPPLFDVFHFVVQDGIQVRHLKPEKLIKRVFKHGKWLSMYCRMVRIKETVILPLLLCYLLDISLLYIEREQGCLIPDTSKVVETWKDMMEIIINHG